MRKINIQAPEFTYDDEDPDGFRAGLFRFGPQLGATMTGTSVYEIPPGQTICPYHYEYGDEEWLIVLVGSPTLRRPEGTETLEPWDVVCFPPGPEGAHSVRNDTDETVRVLMYSTRSHPAATVYPDSDKIGIWTGNPDDDLMVARSSKVGYYFGETEDATD
jgi:uncharacterized cupin superfamily protein